MVSSRRNRDAQYRRELVVNPCRPLYVAAVSPLARQPATRSRHFVDVSDIPRSCDPANPAHVRGICTGYPRLVPGHVQAGVPAGEHGNTNDTWALEYGKFKSRSSMPKGNHPRLEQAQFDIVAEWFARGLPRINNYIAPDTGPTSCTPSITSAVGTHVADMATQGWAAANRQAGLAMFSVGGRGPRVRGRQRRGADALSVGTVQPGRRLVMSTFSGTRH